MQSLLRIMVLLLLGLAPFGAGDAAAFDFSFLQDLTKTGQTAGTVEPTTPTAVIAHFHLNGRLLEKPQEDPFGLTAGQMTSLQTLLNRLDQALDDDNVKAVVFTYNQLEINLAQIEELRAAMLKFRQAGKPLYAHVDSTYLTLPEYALFSAAAELSFEPIADVWITGLYFTSLHLGTMLEKIGVQADFLQREAYKTAGEIFQSQPSPEANENMNWLADGLIERFYSMIAEGRGVPVEQVRGWIDQGLISTQEMQQLGLADAVMPRAELLAKLQEQFGTELRIDNHYGREKDLKLNFSSPLALFSIFTQLIEQQTAAGDGDAVALIYIEGTILPGYSQPNPFGSGAGGAYSGDIRHALKLARDDDSIKAVVLRVDSPGGSALASDIILRATQELEKPLVVSMGGTAASGGYYVACGADAIFADPSTITGSIGVIAGKLVTQGLWDKLGVNWTPYQRGENADIFSSLHAFDETQRGRLNHWMDVIYDRFKDHVVKGRGEKLAKPIGEIAGGRVYTGAQAQKLGLVDELGGLNAALDHAAKLASIEDFEMRILPKPVNPIEALIEEFSGIDRERPSDLENDAQAALHNPLAALLSGLAARYTRQAAPAAPQFSAQPEAGLIALLRQLEPERSALLLETLQTLQVLQEGPALLMPQAIHVK